MTSASDYMDKARRALDGARVLLGIGDTEGACSRAYYAMHDAAHAALLATGHETSNAPIKTHHALIAAFGKTLVLSGQVDAGLGRAFNKVQAMRLLADYSSDSPPVDDIRQAVAQAELFVTSVQQVLTRIADTG